MSPRVALIAIALFALASTLFMMFWTRAGKITLVEDPHHEEDDDEFWKAYKLRVLNGADPILYGITDSKGIPLDFETEDQTGAVEVLAMLNDAFRAGYEACEDEDEEYANGG